jgi:putative DNA methylase
MVLPEHVRDVVLAAITSGHERYFHLHAAVVMPDHVHLLLTPGRDDEGATYGLSQIVSAIKGRSAREVNQALGRSGHVWQPERFDRALRSHERVRAQAEYICQNPVRAGLGDAYRWLWREWVEGSAHGGE